jgi:hypothetical protein
MGAARSREQHGFMKTANPSTAAMKAGLVISALLAGGCASHPVPELQFAASLTAINAAASNPSPVAERDLTLARDKMSLARHLSAGKDQEPARWVAEQAEVDAELAKAKALAARAAREAEQWKEEVRALQTSLPRIPIARTEGRT